MISPRSYERPIPPLSRVRWINYCETEREEGDDWVGRDRDFRIGFYSRQDGLDVIWLVTEDGEYLETVDHDFLEENFELIRLSDIQDPYGENDDVIGPIWIDPR